MKDYSAEEALYAAGILAECYKSSIGEHPWVKSNPEIAIKVEKVLDAMEEAYQAIGYGCIAGGTGEESVQPVTG